MSTINLNKILSTDTDIEKIDKLNSNFNQIVQNGGGPQGSPGSQGIPGLPGESSDIYIEDIDGINPQKTTLLSENYKSKIVDNELEWNDISATPKNAVIKYGYNENDIWVDYTNSKFLVLEKSGDNYNLGEYNINISAANTSLWAEDTSSNADGKSTGIVNSHRYSTLSLTSTPKTTMNNGIMDSADYSQLSSNKKIANYPRYSYKLNIDNASADSSIFIPRLEKDIVGNPDFILNTKTKSYAPILYLGNSTYKLSTDLQPGENNDVKNSFGLLIGSFNNSTDNMSVLSIASSGERDILYAKTSKLGTSKQIFFSGNGDEKLITAINTAGDSTTKTILKVGISTADNNIHLTNETLQCGIIYNYNNGINRIDFQAESGSKIMSVYNNSVRIGPGDNTTDEDDKCKLLLKGDNNNNDKNILQINNNDNSIISSFGYNENSGKKYLSIDSYKTSGTSFRHQPIILQGKHIGTEGDNINSVGIGTYPNSNVKLDINGKLRIGTIDSLALVGNDIANITTIKSNNILISDGGDNIINKINISTLIDKLEILTLNNFQGKKIITGEGVEDHFTIWESDKTIKKSNKLTYIESADNNTKINFIGYGEIGIINDVYSHKNVDIVNPKMSNDRLKISADKLGSDIEIKTTDKNDSGTDLKNAPFLRKRNFGNIILRPSKESEAINAIKTEGLPGSIILSRGVRVINKDKNIINNINITQLELNTETNNIIWANLKQNSGSSLTNSFDTTKNILNSSYYDRIINFYIGNLVLSGISNMIYYIYITDNKTNNNITDSTGNWILYQKGEYNTNTDSMKIIIEDPVAGTLSYVEKSDDNGGVYNFILPSGYKCAIGFKLYDNEEPIEGRNPKIKGSFILNEYKFGIDDDYINNIYNFNNN